MNEEGRRCTFFFFLFYLSDFVIFTLQRHLNTSLSISTSCKGLVYGNLLGLGNNKRFGFSLKVPQFKASYGKYVVMYLSQKNVTCIFCKYV